MQPGLKNIKRKRSFLNTFKGLCLRHVTPEGYFKEAENLSSDGYPTISSRKKRGVISECGLVHAMYDHARMCWVWENALFYGETMVGEISQGPKQFASLGANVVIYPDKLLLNTESMTLTSLENVINVRFAALYVSNRDGTDGANTDYTKIAAAGIGKGFKEGDSVYISGIGEHVPDGNYLVQSQTDDHIVILHPISEKKLVQSDITVQRKIPDLDFICALDNRIWGASSQMHKICACKLGDPTNWDAFEGISTDAYQAIVPSPTPFTGAASDLGSVIFFKEEEIIRVYGNKPSNFQVTSYKMPGVEAGSSGSVAFLESALFYKGLAGIYAYDGGIPECISAFLGDKRYCAARAGAVSGKYYISMRDDEEKTYALFVYDTRSGAWYKESAPEIRYFTRSGNELYMCAADGNMYSANGGGLWYDDSKVISTRLFLMEGKIDWHFETGLMALSMPSRQYVTRLHIRHRIGENAKLAIGIRFGGEDTYKKIFETDRAGEDQTITIPVPARRSDSAALRFSGTGDVTIFAIGKTFEEGSDT